jgi:hypothetical protein
MLVLMEELKKQEQELVEEIQYYLQMNENDIYTNEIIAMEADLEIIRNNIASLENENSKNI